MTVCRPTVLIVDDEPLVLDTLAQVAAGAGFAVVTARSGSEALCRSREQSLDAALLDIRLPGVGGFEVLRALRKDSPDCQVFVMTGWSTVETAVHAIKSGARDYLGKPLDFSRVEQLLLGVKSDVERSRSADAGRPAIAGGAFGMIGSSPAMRHLIEAITKAAPYVRTALISGETGTGKELVARALHQAGRRADKRFVTINCSAVVESLFESELFGHARGAFTGASEAKPGLFEVADGGVLFLDEVGELPASVQAKLLRVLELGEVQRVGALETRQTDVQVVAATNRDLIAEVAAGRFRSDLYYRLNILELRTPPLRARREDIPALADAFLRDCAARWAKVLRGMSSPAQALLMDAPWEGNVRELRNVVERACLLADGPVVSLEDLQACLPRETRLPPSAAAPVPLAAHAPASNSHDTPEPVISPLSIMERAHILRVLEHANGNKKAAARILGVSRRALYRRLERLGLQGTISRRQSPDSLAHEETASPESVRP